MDEFINYSIGPSFIMAEFAIARRYKRQGEVVDIDSGRCSECSEGAVDETCSLPGCANPIHSGCGIHCESCGQKVCGFHAVPAEEFYNCELCARARI